MISEIIVYDIEIYQCILSREQPNDPDLVYCQGWADFAGMTPTVIATCSEFYGVESWLWKSQSEQFLERMSEFACVGGFNSVAFDDQVMAANQAVIETTFDLLQQIRTAAGMPAHYVPGVTRPGYSLDQVAKANDLAGKGNMSGAIAPVLWQLGEHQKVIQYCREDARQTFELLKLFLSNQLKDPTNGKTLSSQMP